MMANTLSYFVDVTGPRYGAMLAWNDGSGNLSELITFGTGDIEWANPTSPNINPSVENWGVSGEYIVVKGYSLAAGTPPTYPAPATKAQIIDIASGTIVPIPVDGKTQPYMPLILPKDPFRMQVWGIVSGVRKYFWQSDFTPGVTAVNPVYGSVEAIQQNDAWWDASGGFFRCTGKQSPYDASGNPQDPGITSLWMETIALGYGPCFTGTDLDPAVNKSFHISARWNW